MQYFFPEIRKIPEHLSCLYHKKTKYFTYYLWMQVISHALFTNYHIHFKFLWFKTNTKQINYVHALTIHIMVTETKLFCQMLSIWLPSIYRYYPFSNSYFKEDKKISNMLYPTSSFCRKVPHQKDFKRTCRHFVTNYILFPYIKWQKKLKMEN